MSRDIQFTTTAIKKYKNDTEIRTLHRALDTYHGRNAKVFHFLMDGQFESVKRNVSSLVISLITLHHQEHLTEVEKNIRTLQEHIQKVDNTLEFNPIPSRRMIE
jgi:hypothetical protein